MAKEPKQGSDEALNQDSSEIETPDLSMFMGDSDEAKEEAAEKPLDTEAEEEEETESDEEEDDTESQEDDESESNDEDEDSEDKEEDEGSELDIESITPEEKVDYLDQLYTSLDDDARREWLSSRDGRIGKDVGKFRKERAIAIEEKEAAEAKYQELLLKSTTDSNSPFASLTTEDAVEAKEKEINSELEAVEKWLNSDEDYLDLGEKSYSARDVAKWPAAYAKQLRMLDKQRETLGKLSKVKDKVSKVEEKLSEEYTWLQDEDSSEYEAYQKLRKDTKWSRVLDLVPELATELPKVLAKYVSDTKPVRKPKKGLRVKGTRKPKGDLGSASSGDRISGKSDDKKLRAAVQRLANGTATEADSLAMFR
jgi:hypothetical protein